MRLAAVVGLILLCTEPSVALPQDTTSLQRIVHPFTHEELVSVFRRFMPEDAARRLADASTKHPTDDQRSSPQTKGLAFSYAGETELTEDTLILLSFLSDSARAKVDLYRRQYWGSPIPPEQEARWQARVAELRAWADAGYPRQRP
jgi:hypothetical protein